MSQNNSINFIKAFHSACKGHESRHNSLLVKKVQFQSEIVQNELLCWLSAAIILEIQNTDEKAQFFQNSWIKKRSKNAQECKENEKWIFDWLNIKQLLMQRRSLSFSQFPNLLYGIIQNRSKINQNLANIGVYSSADVEFFRSRLITPFKFAIFETSDENITPSKLILAYETFQLNLQRESRQIGVFYSPPGEIDYVVFNGFVNWLDSKEESLEELWSFLRTPWIQPGSSVNIRPKNISKFHQQYLSRLNQITILDPACGTGNFLTRITLVLCTLLEYYWINELSIK
jgi:hypothetical protein